MRRAAPWWSEAVGDAAEMVWLEGIAPAARAAALRQAGAVLARHTDELLEARRRSSPARGCCR